MLAGGFAVLRNILSSEPSPTKVIDVKSDQYKSRRVYLRGDGIFLYEPAATEKKQQRGKFEIVYLRPCTETLNQAFSLFRSERQDEAENKFACLQDKLPVLVDIAKEMCTLRGLQTICDILDIHPTWSVAHLAAHFVLYEAFCHPTVNSFMNSTDPSSGMSPLQVAIQTNNLKLVQLLVSSKCSLEHLDHNANTVFHYAASTTKEIITTLSQDSPTCLNRKNSNGHTPLHMACLADKPECVKALLAAGADVNIPATKLTGLSDRQVEENAPGYVGSFIQDSPNKLYIQDMKFGGTPLHWSYSREVIETLVDMGCNINALNFDSRTALHVMVIRNRLECVVALLSREADPNFPDFEGNTPLHLAIAESNVSVVQALIVFGADLEYKNNRGQSPRHLCKPNTSDKILYLLHSVGAQRCTQDVVGCTKGCKFDESFNGIPPPTPSSATGRDVLDRMLNEYGEEMRNQFNQKGGRLLCLDGGGIRGLVLVQMLLEMEAILQRPIQHCFDWIAGTSTGGILALGIASGKTLKECLCLYFRMKEYAFVGGRPYSSETLETILKESLGTETTMTSIKHIKVMITAVLADRKPVDLHLFRNYTSPNDLLGISPDGPFERPPLPEHQLIWQAARATGAAPSYFRAFGRFLDGGLIANNPTLDALTEIHEYNLALKKIGRGDEVKPVTAVVSLGTGLIPLTQYKAIDVFRPERLWDTAKLACGLSSIGLLLVDQATCSDGRVVDRARTWCSMLGIPYFRFTPQLSVDIEMDEKDDGILINVLWEAKAYMFANRETTKNMVAVILSE